MHRIYTSEGIVLGSRNSGEADKLITVFTKKYGLVQAIAKGVRKETSKMRYALRTYSEALVSMVRGKEFWRLTSVQVLQVHQPLRGENLRVVARVVTLMKRLTPPEVPEVKLYETFNNFLQELYNDQKELELLEIAMVLHILRTFGYLEEHLAFDAFLERTLTNEALTELVTHKQVALRVINKALHHSHL